MIHWYPLKKKNDFTNVLVPKGEKVAPVTIKAILRNIANFFKGPVSRRKKWYEPEITVFYFLRYLQKTVQELIFFDKAIENGFIFHEFKRFVIVFSL